MDLLGLSIFGGQVDSKRRVDPWVYLAEKHRTLFLAGLIHGGASSFVGGMPVPHMNVAAVVDVMLALDCVSNEPIKLFIDSYGGGVEEGLMFYDIMQSLRSPVYTVGRGNCSSMAAVLLASGMAEHRYAFANCIMMLHLSRGEARGDYRERARMELVLREYEKRVAGVIIKHCGKTDKSPEQILEEWADKNELWMFPEQALEYGLIDKIITPEVFSQEIMPE